MKILIPVSHLARAPSSLSALGRARISALAPPRTRPAQWPTPSWPTSSPPLLSLSPSLVASPRRAFSAAASPRHMDHASLVPSLRLFEQAAQHAAVGRQAVTDVHGSFSYGRLLEDALRLAQLLSHGQDLKEQRVAYLCPNDYSYLVSQWATWLAGGVAVPLCTTHTPEELDYTLTNSDSRIVLASGKHVPQAEALAQKHGLPFHSIEVAALPQGELLRPHKALNPSREAMMIYTSGTTGKPKGVVHTHANVEAMAGTLVQAWEYTHDDKLLQILPLHHIHGIINILTCCLWAGGHVEMLHFHAGPIWERFLHDPHLSVFTAVPTIYAKLLEHAQSFDEDKKRFVKERMKRIRLMMSGSAALPEPFFHQWEELTGHRLLERFGMTEIGMALTNPFKPASERIPGRVGKPLPGVEVKLKPTGEEPHIGEIFIKGPQVFKEYYKRPDATAESFEDGWFRSGDIAERLEDGTYRILGRHSVDIIKSGGYKISALDIERECLSHPKVKEAVVLGLPDLTWGQLICALIVPQDKVDFTEAELLEFLKHRLAPYKMPRKMHVLKEIPRNAMGKVNKKDLLNIYAPPTKH